MDGHYLGGYYYGHLAKIPEITSDQITSCKLYYSAGKCDRGKTPPPPGGEPPDSLEQVASLKLQGYIQQSRFYMQAKLKNLREDEDYSNVFKVPDRSRKETEKQFLCLARRSLFGLAWLTTLAIL